MATPPTSATGSARSPTEGGFTLVEVLVALVLLALVGITLAEFQTMQAAGTIRLQVGSLARIEADNRAIERMLGAGEAGGQRGTSVNGGMAFAWEATSGPSPDPERFPDLVTETIVVRLAEGGPVLATRAIVRSRG